MCTKKGGKVMKELRDIIDTWNMIQKFDIEDCEQIGNSIIISDREYYRMLDGSVNKQYIINLLRK